KHVELVAEGLRTGVQFPPAPPIQRQAIDSLGVFLYGLAHSTRVCHFGVPASGGTMAVRVAARIYRNRHGMYYFRHVIPVDLRDALQVREVRLSLHTERRHEAIGAALPIVATLHPLVTEIRRMTRSNNENDKARAIRLHEAWMAEVRR